MKYKIGDKVRVKGSGVEHWIKAIHGVSNPSYILLDEPGWFADDEIEPVIDPLAKKIEERNNKPQFKLTPVTVEEHHKQSGHDPIKPNHYRKGKDDLYEAWYRTYPFNEFRAIMQAIAERYMRRDKNDRIEDLEKARYTLERLKEYEEMEEDV